MTRPDRCSAERPRCMGQAARSYCTCGSRTASTTVGAAIGALLASEPIGTVAEWRAATWKSKDSWWQARALYAGGIEVRAKAHPESWGNWHTRDSVGIEHIGEPARLVREEEAGADPDTRGPVEVKP